MQKKLKTFWLTTGFLDRDMELSARIQILQALAKQKVEVRASFNFINKIPELDGFDRVKFIRLRFQGLLGRIILYIEQQIVIMTNLDVDVVVIWPFNIHQIIPLWFLYRKVLGRKKPKFVLDVRTLPADFPGYFRRKLRQKRFDSGVRLGFRYFDGITMITEKMKRHLQNKYDTFKKEICVWTSGVDTNFFDPYSVTDYKGKLNLNNRFVIMYHGIFSPDRGLQQTIEAIDIVRKSYPNIILFLLGKGPVKAELKELVKKLRLEKHVIIHPPVPFEEVPKYIKSAHIGILPFPDLDSWNTSSPIKLNEYLAMGKPVIVTDIAAHRAVLGESKCFFYVEDHLPESLARTIKNVLRISSDLETLKEIARKTATDRFTWEIQAEKIKIYFQNLLN
jgi:glycosyltransferase involved in cell wall biosynthesis